MIKLISILFMYNIIYACSKSSVTTPEETYPTVRYTLNTIFESQVYNTSHSSRLDISVGYMPPILWDGGAAVGSTHVCEARYLGSFYEVHFYDSAVGSYWPERSILVFTCPSLDDVSNYYEKSVLININDTAYLGHAIVSVTFISELNSQTVGHYTTGNFSMSGKVANEFSLDSLPFSLNGTFTNMAIP